MRLRTSTPPPSGSSAILDSAPPLKRLLLDETSFLRTVVFERKRSDRSNKALLLLLVELGKTTPVAKRQKALDRIAEALLTAIRETDVAGWYGQRSAVGVLIPNIEGQDNGAALSSMLRRLSDCLRERLTAEQFSQVRISAHLYPEEWAYDLDCRPSDETLYPDLASRAKSRAIYHAAKRGMDIVGSFAALVAFSPLFAAIALAVKLTSKGPVFFKQHRVGQHGQPFMFLKFRSMHANNDEAVHKQWFQEFMSGQGSLHPTNRPGVLSTKPTNDPRITRVGRILRRTSMDELPQFINVLKGDMSLVGPRPPIPYEVDAYLPWHRRRVLEAKPGITGPWQVGGRSRVTFDEMVRLDVRYAKNCTLTGDLKILLQTPRAVVLGDGAY